MFCCCRQKNLKQFKKEDFELFSFNNYKCLAKIVDVYDGDTFTAVFKFKGNYIMYKFRTYGYDSPEMKPSLKIENRDEVIKAAKEAKQFISDIVLDKICLFESMGTDKYGRLLGKLYTLNYNMKGECVNDMMLEVGYGYPYKGGTKRKNQLI